VPPPPIEAVIDVGNNRWFVLGKNPAQDPFVELPVYFVYKLCREIMNVYGEIFPADGRKKRCPGINGYYCLYCLDERNRDAAYVMG